MGTRNLTMVVKGSKPVIAQYGQWDGYPSGNGVKILTFCRSKKNLANLTEKLKHVRFATKKDDAKVTAYLESVGCKNGWMNMEQAELFHKEFPYASRDIGAGILDLVANSKDDKIVLNNSISFAGDSLFCEWAYVIDLDKNQLEVYNGFNKSPLGPEERFCKIKSSKDSPEYKGIRFLHKYDLDKLPTKAKFISELKKKEKEQEKILNMQEA
jgi:hypothetical protein